MPLGPTMCKGMGRVAIAHINQVNNLTKIDERLREVPVDRPAIGNALFELKRRLLTSEDELESASLLGQIGSYQRILGQLDDSVLSLTLAITIYERLHSPLHTMINRLRLAQTLQYQAHYADADFIYKKLIDELSVGEQPYLDFALQHYGKSLFDQMQFRRAAELFKRALEMRLLSGNEELINSSRYALKMTEDQLN